MRFSLKALSYLALLAASTSAASAQQTAAPLLNLSKDRPCFEAILHDFPTANICRGAHPVTRDLAHAIRMEEKCAGDGDLGMWLTSLPGCAKDDNYRDLLPQREQLPAETAQAEGRLRTLRAMAKQYGLQ
ncbi:MAG: hypothetical protein HY053_07535 [Proteobacteria bacterium]|nr:hypothetical protein [Pseudomonadota bacterium]